MIGAGACGLTAALSVRETGAEVLVLERDPRPTGSTSLSAGLIPAAGTRFQREKGIEDSPELFAADLSAKAHGENDPVLVRAVAEASGPTIDWLADAQGLDLHLVEGFTYPGHSRLRMHGPKTQTGADLEAMLLSAADRAGIDILTGASVEDLYADERGRVAAVGARRPDGSDGNRRLRGRDPRLLRLWRKPGTRRSAHPGDGRQPNSAATPQTRATRSPGASRSAPARPISAPTRATGPSACPRACKSPGP